MADQLIDPSTFDDLKAASGGDFIGELVDAFLDDAPRLMRELIEAVAAGDAETCRRAAHSLKSTSATFGATRLSEESREIEMLAKGHQLSQIPGRLKQLETTYAAVAAELKELRP